MIVRELEVGPLGTNCYIVYSGENADRAAVIDPGDEPEKISRLLMELGLGVEAILLTHGHFDHIGGVSGLLERFGDAKLYACRSEDALLHDPMLNCSAMVRNPHTVNADVLIDDGEIVNVAGVKFRVIATPGHTAGSICFYSEEEKIMFSGDTLFCGSMGRTDLPTGDSGTLAASLRRLKEFPEETVVYPGHGPQTTIGDEKRNNPYLA
ncbi:MAG: MBL fold metallo-hydrolase [Lachnospiraceae bacterium]|nr:MBL fold metallo-hydrolase [Lachnospiraceae bacterium]